jgi:predicted sugar kinase
MRINLICPSLLHLGFLPANDGALCELGITLQHPQIQLAARPATTLGVSGPRADVALATAQKFLHKHHLSAHGDIEIELAIPAHMGLGSDSMLTASIKNVFTLWHDVRTSFRVTLAEHAFAQGGLLLTNDEGLVQKRVTLAHPNDDDAWVFVMVLPKEPDDFAETFETQQLHKLRNALPYLPSTNQSALFDAIARNDFGAFAEALSAIHAANIAALEANASPINLTDKDTDILNFMRAHGAAFTWRAITGLALVGLIKGAQPSRALRKALTEKLGYFGPLVMASICDNHGAKVNQVS